MRTAPPSGATYTVSGAITPAASGWGSALVRYELLLLAELGFGLDLDRCAITGTNDAPVAVADTATLNEDATASAATSTSGCRP